MASGARARGRGPGQEVKRAQPEVLGWPRWRTARSTLAGQESWLVPQVDVCMCGTVGRLGCLAHALPEEAHPFLFTLIKLLTGFWQIGKKSVCSS